VRGNMILRGLLLAALIYGILLVGFLIWSVIGPVTALAVTCVSLSVLVLVARRALKKRGNIFAQRLSESLADSLVMLIRELPVHLSSRATIAAVLDWLKRSEVKHGVTELEQSLVLANRSLVGREVELFDRALEKAGWRISYTELEQPHSEFLVEQAVYSLGRGKSFAVPSNGQGVSSKHRRRMVARSMLLDGDSDTLRMVMTTLGTLCTAQILPGEGRSK